MLLFAMTVNL